MSEAKEKKQWRLPLHSPHSIPEYFPNKFLLQHQVLHAGTVPKTRKDKAACSNQHLRWQEGRAHGLGILPKGRAVMRTQAFAGEQIRNRSDFELERAE